MKQHLYSMLWSLCLYLYNLNQINHHYVNKRIKRMFEVHTIVLIIYFILLHVCLIVLVINIVKNSEIFIVKMRAMNYPYFSSWWVIVASFINNNKHHTESTYLYYKLLMFLRNVCWSLMKKDDTINQFTNAVFKKIKRLFDIFRRKQFRYWLHIYRVKLWKHIWYSKV